MGIQIKKFQAPSLQKAIEQIRAEMGDNAIILQTDPLRSPGALGIFGRNAVEVTAAIDRRDLAPSFNATAVEKPQERGSKFFGVDKKSLLSGLFQGKKAKQAVDGKPIEKSVEKNEKVQAVASAVKKFAAESVSGERSSLLVGSSANANSNMNQLYAMKTFIEPLQREIESLKEKISPSTPVQVKKRIQDPLELEVRTLRNQLSSFITEKRFETMQLPPYYRQLLQFWTEKGMSVQQVVRFFQEIEKAGREFDHSGAAVENILNDRIAEPVDPIKSEKRIVILVGPTGVGKTTTIAKMAAYEKLRLRRSVALMTLDDYKIGGTDQMSHYGRILEVPFIKPRTDIVLEEQCRMMNVDTLFVDTFGVAARDDIRIQQLKKLLSFSDPEILARVEIHLVMPVGVSTQDAEDWVARYSVLNPNYLLFTKWDETENWGGMLSVILASKKPISFICHGQNVPDDMSHFLKQEFIDTVTEIVSE